MVQTKKRQPLRAIIKCDSVRERGGGGRWPSASVHGHGDGQQVLKQLPLRPGRLTSVRTRRLRTHAACPRGGGHPEGPAGRTQGHDELALERLAQDDVDERVDAAVGVAQADGDVVGVQEGEAGPLHPEVGQLQDVVRGPAEEEGQADGHRHAGHLPRAHPLPAPGQRSDRGRHVLENLEEDPADDHPRQSEGQEELVEGEPVGVGGRVGQQEGAAHGAVLQTHESRVHPDRRDGDQGEHPHQGHRRPGHRGRPDVFEADGVDGGQVAVQGHHGQDVSADDLAVGVQRRDDGAHGGAEAPGAVAHQLVDEEGHAEEEEEIGDGQAEDEDVRHRLVGAELGFLHDGVDDDGVPGDPEEADDPEDAGHEGAGVLLMSCGGRHRAVTRF
ncbi:hypothetical protein EYF80_044940 [Liparis tanakae]|uniref:Uncharacterized protein n=1 Tax=Liparis tanakae TaxID=230148 RepID=A0A4Z2FV10_9TELE|nr:hypothetical protein EYF80_044940 [Liparis tanakae]